MSVKLTYFTIINIKILRYILSFPAKSAIEVAFGQDSVQFKFQLKQVLSADLAFRTIKEGERRFRSAN